MRNVRERLKEKKIAWKGRRWGMKKNVEGEKSPQALV